MRRVLVVTAILLLSGKVCLAIFPKSCKAPKRPSCETPCHEPCQSCAESEPEKAESVGYYRPGPGAEYAGESNSLGVRFGALRLPPIAIPLPTLQLPGMVQYRRGPEMYMDYETARFVPGEAPAFELSPKERMRESAPERSPVQKPKCSCRSLAPPAETTQLERQRIEHLTSQVKRLEMAVERLVEMQQRAANQEIQPATLQRELKDWAVPKYDHQKLAWKDLSSAYDEKCREIDAMRRQNVELQQRYEHSLAVHYSKLLEQYEARLKQIEGIESDRKVSSGVRPAKSSPEPQSEQHVSGNSRKLVDLLDSSPVSGKEQSNNFEEKPVSSPQPSTHTTNSSSVDRPEQSVKKKNFSLLQFVRRSAR